MRFEWDEEKSEANERKHGIAFDEARELWSDPFMVVVEVDRNGERRKVGISRALGGYWVEVYTQDGERVRIISVRRATAKEAASYDKANR